jgi:hypothetical protein
MYKTKNQYDCIILSLCKKILKTVHERKFCVSKNLCRAVFVEHVFFKLLQLAYYSLYSNEINIFE